MAQWPVSQPRADGLAADVTGHVEALALQQARLFSGQNFAVQACVISAQGIAPTVLKTVQQLKDFLDKLEDPEKPAQGGSSSSEIFILSQSDARSSLEVTATGAMTLLSHFKVLPAFMHILVNFGAQRGPFSAGSSRFYGCVRDDWIYETAYTLKHVEPNQRSTQWSIRQMAVYQRYHTKSKHESTILIQPSQRVQTRIGTMRRDRSLTKLADHWTSLHQEHLASLTLNWDSYISYIEEKVFDLTLSANFAKVGSQHDYDRVTFKHLQDLHQYSEFLIRITHALTLNVEVLTKLGEETQRRRKRLEECAGFSAAERERYHDFETAIRQCASDHVFLQHHAALVKECAELSSAQIRDTITLQDSNVMLTLTHKTITEAQTMKTLTFIALFYLPISTVASFLQLDYFSVTATAAALHVSVSDPALWFYLALTIPLLVVTFAIWWGWEWLLRRREHDRERLRHQLQQQRQQQQQLLHPLQLTPANTFSRGAHRLATLGNSMWSRAERVKEKV